LEVVVDLHPQFFLHKHFNGLKWRLEVNGAAVLTVVGSYNLDGHHDPSEINIDHCHLLKKFLLPLNLNRQDLAFPAHETIFE
jgi:hypothetical protein